MRRHLPAATTGTALAAATVLLLATGAAAHNADVLVSDGAYDNAKDTHAHEAQHDGEDAVELSTGATACVEDCQAQNRLRGSVPVTDPAFSG